MNYRAFYKELFRPIEADLGKLDPMTLTAVVGFAAGGPVSLATIGLHENRDLATYVTCELSVHPAQRPSEAGNFELMMTCDSQDWAWDVLTRLGDMSLDVELGPGHSLDIGAWVQSDDPIQGILLETAYTATINKKPYAILRCLGVPRDILEVAVAEGTRRAIGLVKDRGWYPKTLVGVVS